MQKGQTRILFTPANIFLGPSLGGVQKKYFIGLTLKCQISRGTSVITFTTKPPHSSDKAAPLFDKAAPPAMLSKNVGR